MPVCEARNLLQQGLCELTRQAVSSYLEPVESASESGMRRVTRESKSCQRVQRVA